MKVILAVIGLAMGALGEPPAPYAPSGWRPDGPAFDLPQRKQPPQEYLPSPIEPRRLPSDLTPDVSVQGLPVQEVTPQFQTSPVSGQEYVGRALNDDVRSIDQKYRQEQIRVQQQRLQVISQQRQRFTASTQSPNRATSTDGKNIPQTPRTTPSTIKMATPDISTTDPTFNIGEVDLGDSSPAKLTSVEVSKQKIQEYPPEILLTPIAQIKLQEYANQQAQLRAPLLLAPENQFDAQYQLANLQTVLAQRQNLIQPVAPNPNVLVSRQMQQNVFLVPQPVENQPIVQSPQYPIQPVIVQPQVNSYPTQQDANVNDRDVETVEQNQNQPQYLYQQAYQPQEVQFQQGYQPQQQVQPQQAYQPNQLVYPQQYNYQPLVNQDLAQFYQNQLYFQQQQQQLNQVSNGEQENNDNGVEGSGGNNDDERNNGDENDDADGSVVIAVANAFGERTRPRVPTQYGVPEPSTRTTTERDLDEAVTELPDLPVVAQATAVARGNRRKNAKLRSRRPRPLFTIDNSGHLVLEQN